MGACGFMHSTEAVTAREGFDMLADEAHYARGWDGYNGTISTTGLRRTIDMSNGGKATKTSTKAAEKKAGEDLENDLIPKGSCWAYDCGIVEYRVSKLVKRDVQPPAAPKYELCWQVTDRLGGKLLVDGKFKTKTEAKNAMLAEFARHPEKFKYDDAKIVRHHVLVSGDPADSMWGIQTRAYKSRPKNIPAGAVLEEIHRFVYAGLAFA